MDRQLLSPGQIAARTGLAVTARGQSRRNSAGI